MRSAWAEMLRGEVDMLYDVGIEGTRFSRFIEARKGVRVSTSVHVHGDPEFAYARARSAAVRRALNFAIDRDELIANALRGHGRPAEGAVWPLHWAHNRTASEI